MVPCRIWRRSDRKLVRSHCRERVALTVTGSLTPACAQGLLPGIKYALEMEFTEIGQIFTHPWTTYKEVHIIHMLDTSLSCAGWCNAYTCSLEACTSCNVCADLTAGLHCSGWCNPWTSWFSHCSGC